MYTFTVEFLNATDYPKVISMSYGVPELDNCNPEWSDLSTILSIPFHFSP